MQKIVLFLFGTLLLVGFVVLDTALTPTKSIAEQEKERYEGRARIQQQHMPPNTDIIEVLNDNWRVVMWRGQVYLHGDGNNLIPLKDYQVNKTIH